MVLHLQAAPRALIHDGSILGGDRGKRRREKNRWRGRVEEGQKGERERRLTTIVPGTWTLMGEGSLGLSLETLKSEDK